MGNDVGHVGAGERVNEEHQGDDHEWRPKRPPRRFEQQDDAESRDDQICCRWRSGPSGKLLIKQEEVARACRADEGKEPILKRDPVPWGVLQRRKGGEGEKDREREMKGARLHVVEHPEPQHEWQGGSVPELKQ